MKHRNNKIGSSDLESSDCNCDCSVEALSRRSFIGITASTATLVMTTSSAFAGPFSSSVTNDHLIPADKKLSAAWTRSLFERSTPESFTGKELAFIGMPVGGICCGQLYLGGDGRLWYWDIFDSKYTSDYSNSARGYEFPAKPDETHNIQGFSIRTTKGDESRVRSIDANGFSDIEFVGQYPIGRVNYHDQELPISIRLEAFSPFVPLNAVDSALPATVMSFEVTNESKEPVEIELAGWMYNSVCRNAKWPGGTIENKIVSENGLSSLVCLPAKTKALKTTRIDIVFADFESDEYEGWTSEGDSFRGGPYARKDMADYQDLVNHQGERTVNSHNARVAKEVGLADGLTGKLVSKSFTIDRHFVSFLICGGRHPGKTCINLVVDGKTIASATGHDSNKMRLDVFDVTKIQGMHAHFEIVDQATGRWGNIGIDQIVFTDNPPLVKPEQLPGYGSMALSLIEGNFNRSVTELKQPIDPKTLFGQLEKAPVAPVSKAFGNDLTGAISASATIEPGASKTITFLVSWWFPGYPNVTGELSSVKDINSLSRHYRSRFKGGLQVATYVHKHFDRLANTTRLWNRTWYDSTLPHWLLDRTFVTLDCLATQTCHWFDNGRFYGWEGVTCCPGTCQHVWNYAQGLSRIFPSLERYVRKDVDYGIGYRESGALDYRAEAARHVAIDGQCGTIVRAFREHTISSDRQFLKSIWPRVKKSIEFMIAQDGGQDGLLEGAQYNTLDQAWYGPMGWISSMYLAALAAGQSMAEDMDDAPFAKTCQSIIEKGRANLSKSLFNGEYFIHKPDPEMPNATNTNEGCHIDQVFGQSLCSQLGLPRVVNEKEAQSSLNALWKYNFAPDAGGYRNQMQNTIKGGRWYAMKGEAGLVMTTWPNGGSDKASRKGVDFAVGYFNECMTGFEYQVAAHMIYEGKPGSDLVEKGLAITRAIHDRYHPSRRNPYNEVECGDHYSRAMASYGVFLGLCGFQYHGPRGEIGFAPRVTPDNFRAPFVAAEGWGTYEQQRINAKLACRMQLHYGKLELRAFSAELSGDYSGRKVTDVRVNGDPAEFKQDGDRITATFDTQIKLNTGDALSIEIT